MRNPKSEKLKCTPEQMEANTTLFMLGDLIGWKLRYELPPSEIRRLQDALNKGDSWAFAGAVSNGTHRPPDNPPDYKQSEIERRAA